MKYNVFFIREDGTDSPHGPAPIDASGIVEAQKLAGAVLADMQADGMMEGWTVKTVVEA